MARKTKIAPPTKKKRTTRKRRSKLMKTPMVHHQLAEHVCSVYDAFCPAARGAKLFDNNSAPSCTYQTHFTYNIASDANGCAMYWITPDPQKCINIATVVANAVTAWSSVDSGPFYGFINGGVVNGWRVVSFGVRYMTTQAWTSATGTLVATDTSQLWSASLVGQGVGQANMDRCKVMPLRDANFTYNAGTRGTENNNYSTTYTSDWAVNNLIIGIIGATASTTVGTVEIVINYEFLPVANSGYATFASPAAPAIPAIMDARSRLPAITDTIRGVKDTAHSAHGILEDASAALSEVAGVAGAAYSIARGPFGTLARKLILG